MCESSRDELRQSGDGRSVNEVVGAGDGVCFVKYVDTHTRRLTFSYLISPFVLHPVINSRFQSYSVR